MRECTGLSLPDIAQAVAVDGVGSMVNGAHLAASVNWLMWLSSQGFVLGVLAVQ